MKKILFSIPLIFFMAGCSTASNSGPVFNDDFWVKVGLAVLGATLSFIVSFTLNQIKQRNERNQLSYDLEVNNGLVFIEKTVRDKVSVLYNGKQVENLFHVKCVTKNTGGKLVKNEFVRFEFSEGSDIIDFYHQPKSEKEMGVEQVQDSSLASHERRFKIGHLEKKQEVGFNFVVIGSKQMEVKLHPYNEQGDIGFYPTSISQADDEISLTRKFIAMYIWLLLLPGVFTLMPSVVGDFTSAIVKLFLFISLIPFIPSFSKSLAGALVRLSQEKTIETQISIREAQKIGRLDVQSKSTESS